MDIKTNVPGTDLHVARLNGQTPELEPYFSYNTHQKTICIIGAGPAGLASLKTVLETEQYKVGSWIPLAFEAREEVGGIWFPAPPNTADPPLTPLYDCLTTNLPHPIMSFRSFPFPPGTPLFPSAEKVHQYFKDFSWHFSLRKHIKFSTSVTSISHTPDKARPWLVRTSMNESYYFDMVMICNGHHRVPRIPAVPGLATWENTGRVVHAAYYRRPIPLYKNKTLLIVGSGPSGHDLAFDLQGHTSRIILSGSNFVVSTTLNGINLRPRLISFGCLTTGTAKFVDGSVEEGIDYCILATGYQFDFPFLRQPLMHSGRPPTILPLPKELYNTSYGLCPLARHIWPLQNYYPPETMPFIGLITRVTPPPLFEAQARAALRAFDTYVKGKDYGARGVDERAEMTDILTRWERLRGKQGNDGSVVKTWHQFEEPESYDYRDRLSMFAETDPLVAPIEGTGNVNVEMQRIGPADSTYNLRNHVNNVLEADTDILKRIIRVHDWERFGYAKKDILRRAWVEIEKKGEAKEWLKNVGNNGIEDWVDLMYRVVQYGDQFRTDEVAEKARL